MRILVAENDAPLADFLCQQLQQEQFSVQVVSDGIAAQQLASDQSYDLVLLDLTLPGAQGLEVLRVIRSKKPDLPVLIVTGANKIEERVRGLDAGADDYIAKPFDFTELRAHSRRSAQGQPPGALRFADRGSPARPHGPRCPAGWPRTSAESQGIRSPRTSHAQRRAARFPRGNHRGSLETQSGHHDQRRRRLHQLSSPKSGLRL